jgi:soluble lytic murein transglycosylase
MLFPRAPDVAPGRVPPPAATALGAARARLDEGAPAAAARAFQDALADRALSPGLRPAVELAAGRAWLAAGEPGLAVPPLARVRAGTSPLAPWAAWDEARAEHARGRHAQAAETCATARRRWPDGPFTQDCLLLEAEAWGDAGNPVRAREAADRWLAVHPDDPRAEPLRLATLRATAATDARAAVAGLQDLVLDHAYHPTGEAAQRLLDALAARGVPTRLPETPSVLRRRAAERRRCGDAHAGLAILHRVAGADAESRAWADANARRFRMDARDYDRLAEELRSSPRAAASAEDAWDRWLALSRGGRWREAAAAWNEGAARHPGRFAKQDTLARARVVAGDWDAAAAAWDARAALPGDAGREARWMAAFVRLRAGRAGEALARLDALRDDGAGDWTDAVAWYRARALDALGRPDEARAARDALRRTAPWSWYGVLAADADAPAGREVRSGRWGFGRPPRDALPRSVPAPPGPVPTGPVAQAALHAPGVRAWGRAAWGAAAVTQAQAVTETVHALPVLAWSPPPPVRPSALHDPDRADTLLTEAARRVPAHAPTLEAVRLLAAVGQYDLSGPVLGRLLERVDAGALGWTGPELRDVALHARDHHHAAKACWSAARLRAPDPAQDAAQRCAFPAVSSEALWSLGARHDVDPLLMLGIMRQESVYRPWARSGVGAIGLVQVMPRTGARMATRLGDRSYTPADLERPEVNLRYGTAYMAALLDRFGDATPLAIASYNGGPHNVSAWLRPWRRDDGGYDVRMDDFVEQIPFPETRDYVKKVTAWYASYVGLYDPTGAPLGVPARPLRDDPTVIDF